MSGRRPDFITFTGADDRTSLAGMAELSALYAIEWGILFSESRQGIDNRYPGPEKLSEVTWADNLRKSAHLCGRYSRQIMDGDGDCINPPADLGYFDRIQINHSDPKPMRAIEVEKGWGPRCIVQCRTAFPTYNTGVDWLLDASGGRGILPEKWPKHPGWLAGYAGGINPENVASVISAINASGPYWIDMESGVRTNDWLDLAKCRAVCEIVFGPPHDVRTPAAAIQQEMEVGNG